MSNTPASTGHLSFQALGRDHMGVAMWQADGTGPEAAAVGHSFQTPLGKITSHYYVASRDYDDLDPEARGGFMAVPPATGFARFFDELSEQGLALQELMVNLPLTVPGRDIEGVDWFYENHIETRYLQPQAPVLMHHAGHPLVAFPADRLVLTERYHGAKSFADVHISIVSEPVTPHVLATDSGLRELAESYVHDLKGRRTRLVVDRVIIHPPPNTINGRVGLLYGDIPSARIEIVP